MRQFAGLKAREQAAGYAFILPFTLGFIVFSIIPFLYVFALSFTNFTIYTEFADVKFASIRNYARLLQDSQVLGSILRSLYYVALYVPSIIACSLVLAVLLNGAVYGQKLLRTLIFMPYVSNFVAAAMIWFILLNPFGGLVNGMLEAVGIPAPLWLAGIHSAMPTAVMIVIWQGMGFHIIAFLAALQTIPKDLYEAGIMDGTNAWQKFRYVTLPTISPTTFFLVVTSIIGGFQNFAPIKILTNGGPGDSTNVFAIHLYEEAFQNYDFSYAAAQAVLMFAIILVITLIQWYAQKKWVTY